MRQQWNGIPLVGSQPIVLVTLIAGYLRRKPRRRKPWPIVYIKISGVIWKVYYMGVVVDDGVFVGISI